MKKFVRFKDLPPDGFSSIYDGDCGIVGKEDGISCFDFMFVGTHIRILLTSVCTGLINDLSHLCDEMLRGNIPAYIIEAEEVGIGTYGEPIVKNATILHKLEMVELTDPPPKFKQDKSNIQLRIKT